MGRWLLLLLVGVVVVSGVRIWRSWGRPVSAPVVVASPVSSPSPLPLPGSRDGALKEAADFVICASCADFVQVAGVGILRKGDRLPDGAILLSWDSRSLLVRLSSGKVEQRFAVLSAKVLADWWEEQKQALKDERVNVLSNVFPSSVP